MALSSVQDHLGENMNRDDRGTTWQYLPDEVLDGGNPVPTHVAHERRDRGFRLIHDAALSRCHRGGSFRDNQERVHWIREFDWEGKYQDDILSIRLVRDMENT